MKYWLDFPLTTIIFIFCFRNWSPSWRTEDSRKMYWLPRLSAFIHYANQLESWLHCISFYPVGQWRNNPQRWPHLVLNLWMYYLTRQRDITNVINWKILRRGDYLRLFKRVQENIRILISEGRGKKESGKEKWLMVTWQRADRETEIFEDATLLALKTEEVTTSQGMQEGGH